MGNPATPRGNEIHRKGRCRDQHLEEPGDESARKAPRKDATTSGEAQEQKQPLIPKPLENVPPSTSAMSDASVKLQRIRQRIMERQREQLELQQKQQQQSAAAAAAAV